MLTTDEAPLEGQDVVEVGQSETDADWLAIVREAYDGSTDYGSSPRLRGTLHQPVRLDR